MVALRQFTEGRRNTCSNGGKDPLPRRPGLAGLPGVDQARLVLDAPTPLLQIKLDEASLKRSLGKYPPVSLRHSPHCLQ